ncbi:DUF922 domain-containing protein [Mucilaginibacter antarcticus]|uniref:DUF922 domain-containing protein n=1 Tax=Mucilaginibacter antarcticus TaxID=1855725 RepID=A0ABW5XLC8_9SPHI
MRDRFVAMMFGLLCLNIANPAAAQPYRQLTTSDFRGTPRPGANGAIAHTKCSINFRYEGVGQGNSFRLVSNVSLMVDPYYSWIDLKRVTSPKQLDRILNHEQGHYMISYMEQQELTRQVNRLTFDAYNYKYQASNLFNRIHAKYEELNRNYDAGTQNMRDEEQQRSWDVYFKKRLTFAPPAEAEGY